MGVSCVDDYLKYSKFSKRKLQDIKHISANAIYRNNSVYKDCSAYKKPLKNTSKGKTGKVASNITYHDTTKKALDSKLNNDRFFWSKVYQSPTPRRQPEYKPAIVKDPSLVHTDFSFLFPIELENDNVLMNAEVPSVPTQTIGTSVTSFLRPINQNVKHWRFSLPRLRCPCCSGGSDCLEPIPYCYESAANSFVSINLKAQSNPVLPSLELDPSLISILRIHHHLKTKKTPKIYGKIVKIIMKNTYKNAVSILEALKAI